MMTVITFDTLKFVETLKESGFDEPQAKGMAVAIQEVQKTNLEALVTKGDLRELEIRLDARIDRLEARIDLLDARINQFSTKLSGEMVLIKWMLALVIAVTVLPALQTLFGM